MASPVLGVKLPFQKQIIQDIISQDGLAIVAKGLGLLSIVSNMCYTITNTTNNKSLILLIGATDRDNQIIGESLTELSFSNNKNSNMNNFHILNSYTVEKRVKFYNSGGIISLPSRVLVVDMLSNVIPIGLITGIIVLHAEKVTTTSVEAFVLRIYRNKNFKGFIKAFSDSPEPFATGFAPLSNIMKNLFINKAFLWPRFHVAVANSLEYDSKNLNNLDNKSDSNLNQNSNTSISNQVIEINVPLSDSLKNLQIALIDCIELVLSELKRMYPSSLEPIVPIDSTDDSFGFNLGSNNANASSTTSKTDTSSSLLLLKSFDVRIRLLLEPVKHRMSPRALLLLADLTTLRHLLESFLSLDAVSFLIELDTILVMNSPSSINRTNPSFEQTHAPWLEFPPAQSVFEIARKRVYSGDPSAVRSLGTARSFSSSRNSPSTSATRKPTYYHSLTDVPSYDELNIKPVLEEQPKWHELSNILHEINNETLRDPTFASGTILIMCSNTLIARQLKNYLQKMEYTFDNDYANSGDDENNNNFYNSYKSRSWKAPRLMQRKLKEYLLWRKNLPIIKENLFAMKRRAKTNINQSNLNTTTNSNSTINSTGSKSTRKSEPPSTKRRRVRGAHSSSLSRTPSVTNKISAEEDDEVLNVVIPALTQKLKDSNPSSSIDVDALSSDSESDVEEINPEDNNTNNWDENVISSPDKDIDQEVEFISTDSLTIIQAYEGDNDDRLLSEILPRYIIMYDPDPAFIRRIEVYLATHKEFPLKVYFLYYGNSVEEQRYLGVIRREKDSFTRVIDERSRMSLVMDTNSALSRPSTDARYEEDSFLRLVNSRIAGGGKLTAVSDPPRVIVDIREFRSHLPSLLHAKGLVVVPCMLTVGDYVLSPKIVVERKSMPDLISSFKDGRLFSQCENMSAYYEIPALLIEFNHTSAFSFEPFSTSNTGSNIGNSSNGSSIGTSVTLSSDLHTKLVLLTLSFPSLRIIWSSSPFRTAEIFQELKKMEHEPDPTAAVSCGLEPSELSALLPSEESTAENNSTLKSVNMYLTYNQAAHDLLSAIPGVSPLNVRLITYKVRDMHQLVNMSEDELGEIVGNEVARTILRFLTLDVRKISILEDESTVSESTSTTTTTTTTKTKTIPNN